MASLRIPASCFSFTDNFHSHIDNGTLSRSRSPLPGTTDTVAQPESYSYSISGTTGVLGSMLFTEAQRIPGTWYDRTGATTALRRGEAELGQSEFADQDFRNSAKRTLQNIESPPKADVDIHFITTGKVENITVRGRRGSQSFRFDFNELKSAQKNAPENADPFKPILDVIDRILSAVIRAR